MLTGCQKSKEQPPQHPPKQRSDGITVIAAIGDSITWGAMAFGEKSPSGGYPGLLETKLRAAGYNVVVFNKGIPGEKAYETHNRFLNAINDADIALLMIGTNDIIRPEGCPEPHNCQTAEHIATMMDKALNAKTVLFISTVTPAQPGCNRSWANPPIQALNEQIHTIAHERNVTLIDNHQAILEHGGGALFADCLHFKDEGYEIIAQQWYDALIESALLNKEQ
jgi:lysophospholipase L1-like esterase